MARYTGPILKKARAYEIEPSIMGLNKKSKRNPNINQRKKSDYGMQLTEKQKAKFIYGMKEKQFRNLYARADKMAGQTGENLLSLLELRLDNVVYRLGFASTRAQARQLVVHGHFTLNGNKVNVPSITLKVGDEIAVKDKSKKNAYFKELGESNWGQASWLTFDRDNLKGSLTALPTKEDLDYEIQESLIVELYSK